MAEPEQQTLDIEPVVSNAPETDNSAAEAPDTSVTKTPEKEDTSVRADVLKAVAEHEEKAQRARDEKTGQYAKEPKAKKSKEAAPEKAAPLTPESSSTPETAKLDDKQPQAVSEPPKAWGKERNDLWNTLPQAAKDFLLTREDQISQGFQQYGPIKQFFDRHQPLFQQIGVQPSQFMENAVSWHQAFSNPQTREAAAREFLASYGINPSTSPPSSEAVQQPFDVNSLQPLIQNQVQQAITPLQQQLQAAQQEKIASEILSWAKDKPHFEKVREQMGRFVLANPQATLDEAYQQAIWANPTIRDELNKTEFDKRMKAEQERSQKAKSATVSTPSRAPSNAYGQKVNGDDKSVRADILRALDQLSEERA